MKPVPSKISPESSKTSSMIIARPTAVSNSDVRWEKIALLFKIAGVIQCFSLWCKAIHWVGGGMRSFIRNLAMAFTSRIQIYINLYFVVVWVSKRYLLISFSCFLIFISCIVFVNCIHYVVKCFSPQKRNIDTLSCCTSVTQDSFWGWADILHLTSNGPECETACEGHKQGF